MQMSVATRALALASALTLAACGFEAPAPRRTPPPPAPPTPLSTLAATLTVPASTIVAELNDKTKDDIARINGEEVNCAITKCKLDLVATKTGPITGSAEDGKLMLDVPLTATADADIKTFLGKAKAHAVATGSVKSASEFRLGSDWRIQSTTTGSVQLSQADLKLGPMRMQVADLWNHNEQHLTQPLFKSLDKKISTSIKIKPQAERLWAKAFRPIRVGKK